MRSYDDLQYRLSDDERSQYERDGFFVIKNALPKDKLVRLQEIFDTEIEKAEFNGSEYNLSVKQLLNMPEYLDVIDNPICFHKIHDLMSCNIQLHMYRVHAKKRGGNWASWHRDNNDLELDLKNEAIPHLSTKIVYILSDLQECGRGNLLLAPGSQQIDDLERNEHGEPHDVYPVCGEPGDAIIFDARLWHSPSDNTSDIMRKLIFIAYSYRWLRPKGAFVEGEDVQPTCFGDTTLTDDPIRRQLLGLDGGSGYVHKDLPLKQWLDAAPEASALLK